MYRRYKWWELLLFRFVFWLDRKLTNYGEKQWEKLERLNEAGYEAVNIYGEKPMRRSIIAGGILRFRR